MTYQQKAVFYRQLGVMLQSGIPLMSALNNLQTGGQSPRTRAAARILSAGVSAGRPFAEMMRQAFGAAITPFEMAVLRVGETSGMLAEIFLRLAAYFEFSHRTLNRLISGMIYPAVLLHAAIIIPAVPLLITRGLGPFLAATLPAFVLIYGVALAVFLLRGRILAGAPLAALWDSLIISVPVFGPLVRNTAMLRFLQAFVCLYIAGVGAVEGIRLAADTMGNSLLRRQILGVLPDLERGVSLAEAFKGNPALPAVVYDMLQTGETSGRIDETLGRVIDYLQHEVEMTTERIVSLLPVIVYLMVAAYVACVVVSFYRGYLNQITDLLGE